MKKIFIVAIIIAGLYPPVSSAQDAEAITRYLPRGFSLISVNKTVTPVSAEIKGSEGKKSTVYVLPNPHGGWLLSSNPDSYQPPGDAFVWAARREARRLKELEKRERKLDEKQQRDQDEEDEDG